MSDSGEYTVGWICALHLEYFVARTVLDEKYENSRPVSPNDTNVYTLGRIGTHKVAITVLTDAEFGTASAAIVAANMLRTFHNIKIGLMVGIAGGLPSRNHDIRLGDVVVNALYDGEGNFIQHDFKISLLGRIFQHTRSLNHLHPMLFTAITRLQAKYERNANQLEATTNRILDENIWLRDKYRRPPPSTDRLFKAEVIHDLECRDESCIEDPSKLVPRDERDDSEDKIAVHYGQVASADQLVKNAFIRDRLAAKADILCFGREAPELMSFLPCLVIQGICDYSDSHQNRTWQGYAAMTAAAYAKDLLCQITTQEVEKERRTLEIPGPPIGRVGKTTDRIDDKSSMLEEPQDYIGRTRKRHPRRIEEFLESAAFEDILYGRMTRNKDTERLLNTILTAEQPLTLSGLDLKLALRKNTKFLTDGRLQPITERKQWMIHSPIMATRNISRLHVQNLQHFSQMSYFDSSKKSAWYLLQLADILDASEPHRKVLSTAGLYMLRGLNDPPPTYRNRRLQTVTSAKEDLKKALSIETSHSLISMKRLISECLKQGRMKRAEKLQVQILTMHRKAAGEDHPSTLRSMSLLVAIYQARGRWDDAEALNTQVLVILMRLLGIKHLYTLSSMSNLAIARLYQGQLKDAEVLAVQVLDTLMASFGEGHPYTLRSLGNLASMYRNMDRVEQAEALHVLQKRFENTKVLPHNHGALFDSALQVPFTLEPPLDCGADLYADFQGGDTEDLDKLAFSLQNPGQESTEDTSNIPRSSADTPISNDHQGLPPTSSKGGEISSDSSTTKKTLDVACSSKTLQPSDGQARFLALCVNTGTIYKTLAEIETSNVKSDAAAFSMLKDEYLKIRGMRSRFRFLVEPIDIEFVQTTAMNMSFRDSLSREGQCHPISSSIISGMDQET
ncbi:uncharacterized protein N7503_000800 [Penicillium pulvis]|uniref:uncharacterized protein n=1 Tax=Penicillium pulvis TaxID=1562058 RepID=UPI0025493BE8|nr:uncharacterized protein N7503_000800 [Penicillium pulvis]KAJ5814050.1 hypothetical protein N7503_000800 [Penicillium pulvis]